MAKKKQPTRADTRRSTWRINGRAIRAARDAKKWTQFDVQRWIYDAGGQISIRVISQIEQDAPIDFRTDTIGLVCNALGISLPSVLHQVSVKK